MADPLYLSLWFPQFDSESMMPHLLSVLRQFPFSPQRPGIEYLSVQPVSWGEPTVLERRFRPGTTAEDAVHIASDLLHSDYAYVFEGHWDLWSPAPAEADLVAELLDPTWLLQPALVRFIAHGLNFDDQAFQQDGHIEIDLGLDTPFLYEEVELAPASEARIRINIQKLVDFTAAVEKNCGISGRLLWSESEENLAQKLMARLQSVQ